MSANDCARCKRRPRLSAMTGCLCGPCEDAIEGMTQAELDADYAAHQPSPVTAEAGEES